MLNLWEQADATDMGNTLLRARRSRAQASLEDFGEVALTSGVTGRLMLRCVDGDGACFFRAMANELGFPEEFGLELYKLTFVRTLQSKDNWNVLGVDENIEERRLCIGSNLAFQSAFGEGFAASLAPLQLFMLDLFIGLFAEDSGVTSGWAPPEGTIQSGWVWVPGQEG